jgi:exodeoxyribonuclease-3
MKIASWNVNGIRAILKKGNLQEFLAIEQPDIICLQEIKGEKSLIDIDFKDYFEYWNPAERKGYSGTAVFSKTEPLSVTYNFPEDFCKDSKLEDEFGHTNTEGRIITVEYKNFFLVTVYTPNVKRSLERLGLRHSEWDKLFLKYLKKLESKKPVIFCGDLNVAYTENDLARPKDNIGNAGFTNEERSGFGEYLKADFVDTWRMFVQGNGVYTWWSNLGGARSRNVGWRIDYIMISKSLQKLVSQAYIYDKVLGSDHCPVAIDINL